MFSNFTVSLFWKTTLTIPHFMFLKFSRGSEEGCSRWKSSRGSRTDMFGFCCCCFFFFYECYPHCLCASAGKTIGKRLSHPERKPKEILSSQSHQQTCWLGRKEGLTWSECKQTHPAVHVCTHNHKRLHVHVCLHTHIRKGGEGSWMKIRKKQIRFPHSSCHHVSVSIT